MPPAALPGLLEAAEAGDLDALARLYAMAAVCAREGHVMPPELAQFIARTLESVATSLFRHIRRPKDHPIGNTLAKALGARRTGKRGARKDAKAAGYARILASNIAQRVVMGMTVEDAIAAVQADQSPSGNPEERKEDALWLAWRKHRAELLPSKG